MEWVCHVVHLHVPTADVTSVDYSTTKGAIVTFTRSLSVQLTPKGIRVNAVAPGPVITALQAGSRPPENMEGLGVGMPLHGRAGQPAELGPAFVFLASSDSNIMTGHVLHINSESILAISYGLLSLPVNRRAARGRILRRLYNQSTTRV